MIGCAQSTLPKKVYLPTIGEDVKKDCPKELPQLENGKRKEVLRVINESAAQYHECRETFSTFKKEYENVEEAIKEFNKR